MHTHTHTNYLAEKNLATITRNVNKMCPHTILNNMYTEVDRVSPILHLLIPASVLITLLSQVNAFFQNRIIR